MWQESDLSCTAASTNEYLNDTVTITQGGRCNFYLQQIRVKIVDHLPVGNQRIVIIQFCICRNGINYNGTGGTYTTQSTIFGI